MGDPSGRRGLLLAVVVCVAASWACGTGSASSPNGPDGPGAAGGAVVAMNAAPNPVAVGATLTYTVTVSDERGGTAPAMLVHLPTGAADIDASGPGWSCSPTTSSTDAFVTGSHTDLSCASAVASMVVPPLTVTIKAPAIPGMLRACAETGRRGASNGASTCVDASVG